MDMNVILTSTVIAAVISLLANVYNSRRTGKLKYITEERQKWREDIREIAENITKCSQFNIGVQLTRLKMRINANGVKTIIAQKEGYNKKRAGRYLNDVHIWKLIDELENPKCIDKFEDNKKKLFLYLSALLKYDWERAKQEVKGSELDSLQIVFSVLSSGIYLWLLYTNEKDFISMQSVSAIALLLIPCAFIPIYKLIHNILKKYPLAVWGIFIIITMVIVINLYKGIGVNIENLLKILKVDNFQYIVIILIFISNMIITLINLWKLGTKDFEYIKLIESIETNF